MSNNDRHTITLDDGREVSWTGPALESYTTEPTTKHPDGVTVTIPHPSEYSALKAQMMAIGLSLQYFEAAYEVESLTAFNARQRKINAARKSLRRKKQAEEREKKALAALHDEEFADTELLAEMERLNLEASRKSSSG